jgi:cytochrome c-type protein NapC
MSILNRIRTLPVAFAFMAILSAPAAAVDWSRVDSQTIPLFYTGQASWEWMLTQSDHSGAKDIRQGAPCARCHSEDQTKIGTTIVSGQRLEPQPPKKMPGFINATVQIAHDDKNFYVRVSWPAVGEATEPGMDADHPARISLMLDDGTLKEAKLGGCWGTCHDDVRRMASDTAGLDLTKYILASRTKVTRAGGGDNIKDASALKSLIGEGKFFEYWQARVDNQGASSVLDGYILERRHDNDTPIVSGEMSRQGDNWVAVMSRPLSVASDVHKPIVAGKSYTLGFAIHSSHSAGRYHHVSLEKTMQLDGGNADLIAKKLP